MIVVNSSTRQFNIPGADMTFGVEADNGSERKVFQCPRYVGNGLDVAGSFVRINYRNANGEIDSYLVNDVTVDGDNITFTWELTPKVTAYKGQIRFVMCVTGPDAKVAWHTTLGTGVVLEGLEPDYVAIQADTADVVAQLIALVERQTAAVKAEGTNQVTVVKNAAKAAETASVAQVEAKGASTLATIPEDYTAVQNAVRGVANAIRGKVSGEVVRVDDVSPVEHYPEIRVSGKNILPYPYKQNSATAYGGTFTVQSDGGVLCSGIPTDYVSLNLNADAPLVKSGNIVFSASGDYENVNISMVIYDKDSNVLFTKETWKGASPISVNMDNYPTATRWLVFLKRGTPNQEMRGTLYPQIEAGTTATAYTPYIDPTTVTVTRCGRNLLPYPFYNKSKVENGITFTDNGDGTLTVDGTATDNAFFHFLINSTMKVKGKYVMSGLSGGSGTTYYIQPFVSGAAVRGLTNESMTYDFDGILEKITMVVSKGTSLSKLSVKLQLEKGEHATAFEKYHTSHLASLPNGTVSGFTAVSPIMTLMTDTAGVTIDCEYSRDTNKVIAEILNKITALGG